MAEHRALVTDASIAWVALCEAVVPDEYGRLSLMGIASHLPVPSLPLLLHEHVVVARMANFHAAQTVDVSFGIVTPAGLWVTPTKDASTFQILGEFIIITVRSLPLRDEGVHRFEVGLGNGSAGSVEVPVWLAAASHGINVH